MADEPQTPHAVSEPETDEHGYTKSGVVTLDGQEFTRDEVRMLYHASFYLTNEEQPLPPGHPPTHAMLAQMKLAAALNEEVPDAALQNVQRALESAKQRAIRLQNQRELVAARKAEVERQVQVERQRQDTPAPEPEPTAPSEPAEQ